MREGVCLNSVCFNLFRLLDKLLKWSNFTSLLCGFAFKKLPFNYLPFFLNVHINQSLYLTQLLDKLTSKVAAKYNTKKVSV